MSIINQMLRDLDARHASTNERAGLPANLRTLPPEQAKSSNIWLLLLAGLLAGALIAWFVAGRQSAPPVAAPPPEAAASPAPLAPPALPPAPPQAVPPAAAPVAVAPAPNPVPAPVPAPKPAPVAKAPAPLAAPVVAAPAEKPADKPTDKSAKPVVAPPVASVPAGEAQIDKQPRGGVAREQAEAEYRRGMQAAGSGDSATALPALRRALELEPQHAKARQALLSVLAGSRQWDEVRRVAEAGLALDPTKSGWAVILARLQHEQGDTGGAVRTLEAHAAHAAGDADYQGLLAFLLQKSQRPAEAAQRYQAALGVRPGEGRWWYGLGLALEAAGRGDEAKAAFGRARDTGSLSADMLGIIEQKLR